MNTRFNLNFAGLSLTFNDLHDHLSVKLLVLIIGIHLNPPFCAVCTSPDSIILLNE